MSEVESPEQRARHLIDTLLPKLRTRDEAMNHLYYRTPEATPELRLWSLAAALYILNDRKCACGRHEIPEGRHSVDAAGFEHHNRHQCLVPSALPFSADGTRLRDL